MLDRRYGADLEPEAREFLEFAVDGADRMRRMIDALLEYSRIESEGATFESVDLDDVLDAARKDLEPRIEESDAEIDAESLPTVDGDTDQLRRVFQNLLDNAIEYSGDDPPRIRVTIDRERDEYRVGVHDEGIGIDPENADQVFGVFERLHTQAEHPGAGIGLSICRRIIERHGGSIGVDSEPEAGSTFWFTLPRSPTEPA